MPKPLQKPHPPVWVAAVSGDSFGAAGKRGLNLLCAPASAFMARPAKKLIQRYHDGLRLAQHPTVPREIGALCMVLLWRNRRAGTARVSPVRCCGPIERWPSTSLRPLGQQASEGYEIVRATPQHLRVDQLGRAEGRRSGDLRRSRLMYRTDRHLEGKVGRYAVAVLDTDGWLGKRQGDQEHGTDEQARDPVFQGRERRPAGIARDRDADAAGCRTVAPIEPLPPMVAFRRGKSAASRASRRSNCPRPIIARPVACGLRVRI